MNDTIYIVSNTERVIADMVGHLDMKIYIYNRSEFIHGIDRILKLRGECNGNAEVLSISASSINQDSISRSIREIISRLDRYNHMHDYYSAHIHSPKTRGYFSGCDPYDTESRVASSKSTNNKDVVQNELLLLLNN